jgi:hypothetical protein
MVPTTLQQRKDSLNALEEVEDHVRVRKMAAVSKQHGRTNLEQEVTATPVLTPSQTIVDRTTPNLVSSRNNPFSLDVQLEALDYRIDMQCKFTMRVSGRI